MRPFAMSSPNGAMLGTFADGVVSDFVAESHASAAHCSLLPLASSAGSVPLFWKGHDGGESGGSLVEGESLAPMPDLSKEDAW
jgi:hypothetical protein